jgi:hypothetical protein
MEQMTLEIPVNLDNEELFVIETLQYGALSLAAHAGPDVKLEPPVFIDDGSRRP